MATTNKFYKSRTVRELTVTLTYSDTTSAKMFTLPESARIVDYVVNVQTAFSGGTTDLDIGTSSDGDYLVDGATISSVGRVSLTTEVQQPGYETTAPTDIYMNVGASNTAGSVEVTVLFSMVEGVRI